MLERCLVTAAAVGPKGVTAAEWMSLVWNTISDAPELAELRAPVESALSAMWSEIVDDMRDDAVYYVPKFMGLDDEAEGAREWALGFRTAMSLRPAAWSALIADPLHGIHALPIILLSLDDDELVRMVQPTMPGRRLDLCELRQDYADDVVEAVAGLYRYWHGRHRRSVQAVGRNAPCPCGSGRKYKKCCLR